MASRHKHVCDRKNMGLATANIHQTIGTAHVNLNLQLASLARRVLVNTVRCTVGTEACRKDYMTMIPC